MRVREVHMQITVGEREHVETVQVLITPQGVVRWGASRAAISETVDVTTQIYAALMDEWRGDID